MNPKKSFYQWRLRVPSNYIVRLVVLTLHGVTPGSCASHRLSAYDFLLPLQNKIITRYDPKEKLLFNHMYAPPIRALKNTFFFFIFLKRLAWLKGLVMKHIIFRRPVQNPTKSQYHVISLVTYLK